MSINRCITFPNSCFVQMLVLHRIHIFTRLVPCVVLFFRVNTSIVINIPFIWLLSLLCRFGRENVLNLCSVVSVLVMYYNIFYFILLFLRMFLSLGKFASKTDGFTSAGHSFCDTSVVLTFSIDQYAAAFYEYIIIYTAVDHIDHLTWPLLPSVPQQEESKVPILTGGGGKQK